MEYQIVLIGKNGSDRDYIIPEEKLDSEINKITLFMQTGQLKGIKKMRIFKKTFDREIVLEV